MRPEDAYGLTPWDRSACAKAIAASRSEGRFTPPSEQGTLEMPFTGGGTNWGGVAVDGEHALVFANTSNMIHRITLFPAAQFAEFKARFPGKEISPQTGAPFGMMREVLLSPIGLPCNPPPWGTLSAVDLNSRKILWQTALGTVEAMNPLGLARRLGTPTLGGPLATSGGLVFIGAAMDDYLSCAIRCRKTEAPSSGPAACRRRAIRRRPRYEWQGRQYVVIAARWRPWRNGQPGGERRVPGRLRAAPARKNRLLLDLGLPVGSTSRAEEFELHAGMAALALVAALVLLFRWRRARHRRHAQAAR